MWVSGYRGEVLELMLQAEGVTFVYPGQGVPALYDVSVAIEEGSFLAVMGANGSGKTTLCKLFNGVIPHFFVGDLAGTVRVDGIDTVKSDVSTLSGRVGYVYQDFEDSIVRPTVIDEVSFAALNYGFDDYRDRADTALDILGIPHLRNEYVWQLSGGQKHLVALAAVLAVNPDYIIVDEPVAQLDPYHARQTYDRLKLLNEAYKKTIIVIEHHTEFIAQYCHEVLLMRDGRVLWKKPVQAALTGVEELLACQILPPQVTQAAQQLEHSHNETLPVTIAGGAAFFAGVAFRTGRTPDVPGVTPQAPTVRLRQVTAAYKDYHKQDKVVLSELDLSFFPDERIAVVGSNGAGKSTLLRLISRLLLPASGAVEVLGTDTAAQSPEDVADVVSFIYQNPEEMFIDDSIERDVAYFLRSRQAPDFAQQVERILETLNLVPLRDRDARLLSGGQQRRVSLAIGMGMKPRVILLDEPTASLDIASRRQLVDLLHLLRETIETAVVATHDMQLVADWATRAIVLDSGRLIFDGTPRRLFDRPDILERASLIPPQIVELSHRLAISPPCLSVAELVRRAERPLTSAGGGA